MNRVTVIGSINLDRTIRVPYMPKPGETMHSTEVFSAGGGKGANQAVAAARLGAETRFIGAVGDDESGQMTYELLSEEGIDLEGVARLTGTATGQAYIIVDDNGENSIMLHGGANQAFTPEHVRQYEEKIANSDFVITQFESDVPSSIEAFKLAHQHGVKTILNPAPAMKEVPKELLENTDMIVPNETETEILTGIHVETEADMKAAAKQLHDQGVPMVLITVGSKGAFYDGFNKSGMIPAFKVKAVDTTAAGDTFIGALASELAADFSNIEAAIKHANKASSLTVQRFGAQPSIPYLSELEA
ncbi:MAG: ribokinase [Aerococcus sp.]|nr:ribokinase [Aerococcus sp.]